MQSKSDFNSALASILASDHKNALVICPDSVRRRRVVDHLMTGYLANISTPDKVKRIPATELGSKERWAKFIDEFATQSLFEPLVAYEITGIGDLGAERQKDFIPLLSKRGTERILVLSADKIGSNLSLVKFFEKQNRILRLDPLQGPSLHKWAQKEAKNRGLVFESDEVAGRFISYAEESADLINRHLEHFELYLGASPAAPVTLGADHIESSIPLRRSVEDFALVDAIQKRNISSSLNCLESLTEKEANPFGVISLLSKNLSVALLVSDSVRRKSALSEVKREIDLPPWLFSKLQSVGSSFSPNELTAALQLLARVDVSLKSKSVGPKLLLSGLSLAVSRRSS